MAVLPLQLIQLDREYPLTELHDASLLSRVSRVVLYPLYQTARQPATCNFLNVYGQICRCVKKTDTSRIL